MLVTKLLANIQFKTFASSKFAHVCTFLNDVLEIKREATSEKNLGTVSKYKMTINKEQQ